MPMRVKGEHQCSLLELMISERIVVPVRAASAYVSLVLTNMGCVQQKTTKDTACTELIRVGINFEIHHSFKIYLRDWS